MAALEIGKEDPTGAVVKSILGMNSVVQVYTTEDQQLRWNYVGDLPDELQSAVSRFDLLMSETKAYVPSRQKRECLILLGKLIFNSCRPIST